MTQISATDRARIFAAYWGAKVVQIQSDGDRLPLVVDWEFMSSLNDSDTDEYLLLTPVERITDEDATRIMEIRHKSNYSSCAVSVTHFEKEYFCVVAISFEGKVLSIERIYFNNPLITIEEIDYLRSRSYNIGYGKYSAADLVAAGVVKYGAI